MLKGIKDILKTMGEALSFADAGEMLSEEQKTKVLNQPKGSRQITPTASTPRVVLASDVEFSPAAVDCAIDLCRKKHAMLDLLCVSQIGSSTTIPLETVLPNLASETNLDFQVTRRHGDLLVVTTTYLRAQRDILTILINVSNHLHSLKHKQLATTKETTEMKLRGVDIRYIVANTNELPRTASVK